MACSTATPPQPERRWPRLRPPWPGAITMAGGIIFWALPMHEQEMALTGIEEERHALVISAGIINLYLELCRWLRGRRERAPFSTARRLAADDFLRSTGRHAGHSHLRGFACSGDVGQ